MAPRTEIRLGISLSRRLAAASAGAIVNLVVSIAPLAILPAIADRRTVISYLVSVGLIFAADLPRALATKTAEQLSGFHRYQRTALAGGLLLLVLQWGTLSEACLNPNNGNLNALFIYGMLLVTAGAGLRFWSVASLGTSFVSDRHDQPLVTTGIYRLMRHPSETGLIVASCGLLLAMAAWRSAILILPFFFLTSLLRVREEERWLLQDHGQAYASYRQRTGWYLPVLYKRQTIASRRL